MPLQLFVVHNNSSCGGSIGPMVSAALGARALDLSNLQLSIHSICEAGGTHDVQHGICLFTHFFKQYLELSNTIFVD